jgi:hypothetical protein
MKRLNALEAIAPADPWADWLHIATPTAGGYLMRRISDNTEHVVNLDDLSRIAKAGGAPVIILDK